MADIETAKRYAKAVFELAVDEGVLETVHGDLSDLKTLVEENAEFKGLITNPLVESSARQKVLKSLLSGKIHELSMRFLCFLDEKKRINALVQVVEQFDQMYLEKENIVRAVVVSAAKLDNAQLDNIRQRLEKRFKKNIQLTTDLDPDLIGGFLVKVGDSVFDYTIKHQLESVKQKIVSAHGA